ncbi:MAG: cytochrome b [Steroidobacteraceae bacterium]
MGWIEKRAFTDNGAVIYPCKTCRPMKTAIQSNKRYTTVAIALHWGIAILILFNLGVGFFMEGLEPGLRNIIVPLHISSGITVLILTVLRLGWRFTHPPPPLPAEMTDWERRAAHTAHAIIYFLMLAMPVTGWAIVSAHPPRPGAGPLVWGLLHLPPIPPVSHLDAPVQKAAHESFVRIHSIGGWIYVALLTLHIAAALKHQFYDRHAQFARMGVGRLPSGEL